MKAHEITPEILVDLLLPCGIVLSPDGDRVVYSAAPIAQKGEHVLSSLWLADTAKEHSARQITSGLFNDRFSRSRTAEHVVRLRTLQLRNVGVESVDLGSLC